ncbi:hypothetical protein HDE_00252 [Halotydeus destructor]|nr:hypothetical protein HDE_00252 [Halotydeus destructor]
MIALTKSADCQPAKAQCPGQVSPDAVLLTANETRVYKDSYVHNLIHQPQRMPVIIKTSNISDETNFPSYVSIKAVVQNEKRRYFVEDKSKFAMMCTDILHSCQLIEIKSPTRSFKLKNLSAAAAVSQGYFLAFVDGEGEEYQAIMDDLSVFLHTQKLDKMADGRKRNPTGLSVYGMAGNKYRCVVFFDVIYGFHIHDLDNFTEPVVMRKTLDYRLSNTWLGCDPELCFDARVDFAYHDQGSIVMGSGRSRWRIDPSKRTGPHALKQDTWAADSIDKRAHLAIVFRENMATVNDSGREKKYVTKDTFKEMNSAVEAAFSMETSQISLISDQSVYIYKLTSFFSTKPYNFYHIRTIPLRSMFNTFEKTIDAAESISGTTYLFRRNHFYSHNVKKNITSTPMLIQNSLFPCSDSFYSSFKASQMLSITNAEQFKQYRMQFVATNSTEVTTSSSTISSSTISSSAMASSTLASSTASSKISTASKFTKVSRKTVSLVSLTLILLIVSATICFLSIMTLWVCLKNMKPSSEDTPELFFVDVKDNQGSVSTETTAGKLI